MTPEELHKQLLPLKEKFREALNTERGSWFLKEYNIASDISVTSNIIEGILSWVMLDFASQYDYRVVMKDYVSIYPYMSLIVGDGSIFAVDFRSAYRTNESTIDGFPLGSFTGYFRQRQSRKLITFPYSDYAGHFVICAISSPRPDNATIESIIDDFDVVIQ